MNEVQLTQAPVDGSAAAPIAPVVAPTAQVAEPVVPVATPKAQALIKVHKTDTVAERTFWIGHAVFLVLAVVGLAFIIFARGPRRRDVILSSVSEGKE